MNGKDFINEITSAKMPNREQVRENCLQSTTVSRTPDRIGRRIVACACGVAVIAGALVFGLPMLNNLQPPVSIKNPPVTDNNSVNNDNTSGSNDTKTNDPNYAVYVPQVELHEPTDGVAMDMIGLFVYKGRIYTQAGWAYGEDAVLIKKDLVGERLGYAKGNLNEWSTQDDYATEFAGSAAGDVYTVKGYDESFRLCMTNSYTDDDGNLVEYVNFYENLNGIGLKNGEDLFGEQRLKLAESWRSVKYQKHADWDYTKNVYNDLSGITHEDIDMFLKTLYSGKFEYAYETIGDEFYDSGKKQAHLYFTMADGTTVQLRLVEGGYVGYQPLGWYFVRMPGEVFDLIFSACQ